MEYRELRKKLQKAGWEITNGKAHDQSTHADRPGVKIAIPGHKGDVPIGTANIILKAAEPK